MSRMVEVRELRHQDKFEMPNGSVFAVGGHKNDAHPHQARLWCAHPPDAITPDPPSVDLTPEQMVRLLSGGEADEHYAHDGYVETVFRRNMDQRHHAKMQSLGDIQKLERTEQQQQDRANRPWWKKLFG